MSFEELAEKFYQKYGYFPPGKDNSPYSNPSYKNEEERMNNWLAFLKENGIKV